MSSKYKGKVIVIGAGVAGLSAAYSLHELGIDFEILEATDCIGGRTKTNHTFTDFPLPMGAEWIETDPVILQELVGKKKTPINIKTFADEYETKFFHSSWQMFFEEHILPSIEYKLHLKCAVEQIDYSSEKINLHTTKGIFEADKIILAVPLKVLQSNLIQFLPVLPPKKIASFNACKVWNAYKAFIKFKSPFYDEGFEYRLQDNASGQKFLYDAAYGQKSRDNIFGILTLGDVATEYHKISEKAAITSILNELDERFDGNASPNYLEHIVQDWQKEPFIQAGYLSDYEDHKLIKRLRKPVEKRIYFAGGAFTDGEDWVSVHVAAGSGKQAVQSMLKHAKVAAI